MSVLLFYSFTVAEIGENASDARRSEHVNVAVLWYAKWARAVNNDADGVLSPIGLAMGFHLFLPNTAVKPIYVESTCLETSWEDR